MKKLFLISILTLTTAAYAQDFIQTSSLRVNEQYYNSIKGYKKIYEYVGENVSIQLYQEPIDWVANNESLDEGAPSIIKINDYYLPIDLGDENSFIVKDLVNGGLPEIILYSSYSCQSECSDETYIINFFEDKPFIISKLGFDIEIIENKGEVEFYDFETETEKTFEYNYPKDVNEFFIYEGMRWIQKEEACYTIIQSITYNISKGYSLGNIKWKMTTICAACFTGDMLVSINDTEKKPISSLKVGDQVLTYDFASRQNNISQIEEIISVPHDVYIEYHFEHDSITATLDHPFYAIGKGWSSFHPEATISRYKNYDSVGRIAIGDVFKLSSGKESRLIGYNTIQETIPSYTITKLSNGNSFYVNDILVGVENFDQRWLHKK